MYKGTERSIGEMRKLLRLMGRDLAALAAELGLSP